MILVTGGTGILGGRLLFDLTRKGEKVRAIKRPSSNLNTLKEVFKFYGDKDGFLFNQIEWINADLLNLFELEDALLQVEAIYHCAALVSFHHSDKDWMYQINVIGTRNLINLSIELGVKTFCHVSSTAAINLDKNNIGKESIPWKNGKDKSYYGVTKYLSELEVFRGQEEGLNIVIINPSMILGAGVEGRSSSGLFQTGKKGLAFYPGGSNAYVDVRDVSKTMLFLVEHKIFGERLLVFSENYTFKAFFIELCRFFNSKQPSIAAKPWMVKILERIQHIRYLLTKKKPLITKETCKSAMKEVKYSDQKLKTLIPFPFIPVRESINYFGAFYKGVKS